MNKHVAWMLFPSWVGISSPFLARADAGSRKCNPFGRDLFDTLSALDIAVFDAFNHCSSKEHCSSTRAVSTRMWSSVMTMAVTWNRRNMITNTRKNVCGHFTRERVPGSLAS